MNQFWLADIVARASPIAERLAGGFDVVPGDAVLIDARLARWRQVCAPGGGDDGVGDRFERRLAYDGLDVDAVRSVLGRVRLAEGRPLPAWTQTLREVLAPSAVSTGPELALDPQEPLPFEDVLLPFVQVARRRLCDQPGLRYARLNEGCRAALERDLLRILSYLGARTLLLAFAVFRTTYPHQKDASSDAAACYRAFVADLLDGGLRELFADYPVLARLLAERTDAWADAVAEFLQRLRAEFDVPLSAIRHISPSLSDPHADGRAVIAVEFAAGHKVIYKPRSVGPERAFQHLVTWLNERRLTPPLRTLHVTDRITHGWVEFATHRPCQTASQVQVFYRRAGMLLALFHALQSTDYHYENLIAATAQPLPVDHEMVLGPYLRQDLENIQGTADGDRHSEHAIYLLAQQHLGRSVLGTGLLPIWEAGLDGQAYDISGLSGGGNTHTAHPVRRLTWQQVNTDRMRRTWEMVTDPPTPPENVPLLDGVPYPINTAQSDLRAEFLEGFAYAYRFLMTHREALLAPDGPLAPFADCEIRFTFRRTSIYWALLEDSLAPRYMRDGAERSIHLDLLARALFTPAGRPALWPVVAAEQAALSRADIPRFTTPADGHALFVGDEMLVADSFIASGYGMARQQIAKMDEEDLERQMALIQAALAEAEPPAPAQVPMWCVTTLAAPAFDPATMMQQVAAIAGVLARRALRSPGKRNIGVTWIHLAYDDRLGHYQLQPLAHDLYGGVSGVALFLAALHTLRDEPELSSALRDSADEDWAALALSALYPLRQTLAHTPSLLENQPIGAGSGLGSLMYSLARVGQWVGDAGLLRDAQQVAALLTAERVAQDRTYDIISGAAGAILGLLSLPGDAPIEKAIICGRRLLETRVAGARGGRAWPSSNGIPLTGFSHGAAGVAYSLLRLYGATGDSAFLEAAGQAVEYERGVFDPQAGNWPDFREPGTASFMVSWCHGAPGIGLARLGGLERLDTAQVRADIEVALATTQAYGAQGLDHLCCGTLGRVEFLLEAARRLSRPELAEKARAWAAHIVARAKQAGGYTLSLQTSPPQWLSPGFFQGLAGVGYELLRLTYPDRLPAVLLWE